MKKPYITIVTCTYNSQKYLKKNLESVKGQTFRNFEHIFVDGYSKDKTINLIKCYAKENPDITIKIIKAYPLGISNAMNIGIKNARGKVIHFLNSDDYYYSKESLSYAANAFLNEPKLTWLIGESTFLIKGKVRVIKNYFNNYTLQKFLIFVGNCISHPNIFVSKTLFNKYGLFNENLKFTMDYEFWMRIIKFEKPLFVNTPFAAFRIHKKGATSNIKNFKQMKKEEDLAFKKNFNSNLVVKIIRYFTRSIANISIYFIGEQFNGCK